MQQLGLDAADSARQYAMVEMARLEAEVQQATAEAAAAKDAVERARQAACEERARLEEEAREAASEAEAVRRAAPFPEIPDGAGRASWPFSVPISFKR